MGTSIPFFSAGGGSGYWGAGAGASGGAHGGGGGSGYVRPAGTSAASTTASPVQGIPEGLLTPGYVAGVGYGGRATPDGGTSGGPGLVLIGW